MMMNIGPNMGVEVAAVVFSSTLVVGYLIGIGVMYLKLRTSQRNVDTLLPN